MARLKRFLKKGIIEKAKPEEKRSPSAIDYEKGFGLWHWSRRS